MLDGLRAASQSLLGRALLALMMSLIVVSFAIFGIGNIFTGYGAGRLAQVGPTEITSDAFRFAYQNELQRIQRQARRAVTNDEARAAGLDRQVLARLITEAVLDQKAKALGLAMSDEAVARAIAADPSFKDGTGRFDPARFAELLRDNGYNERGFVRQQRAGYLRQELVDAVAGKITAPHALLAAIQRFQNETRAVDYFVLAPASVEPIPEPDDKILQTFYDDHRSEFTAPEYRRIAMLAVTPTLLARADSVSDADAMKLYDEVKAKRFTTAEKRQVQQIVFPDSADAQAAAQKIRDGATFQQIADERKLASADIDLGLVTRTGIGNTAVAKAAFELPDGGTSDPVPTQFGAALVHVVSIAPAAIDPFDKVAPGLKNEIARERAKKQVRNLHDKIEDQRSGGKSLTDAAVAVGLAARAIDAVDAQGRDKNGAAIPDLTGGPDLLKAVFASDIGVDNDTVTTPDDGYVWYEVAATDPARPRTLAEVRDKVVTAWKAEETRSRLAAKASAFVKEIDTGGDLAKAGASVQADVRHDVNVKRSGSDTLPPGVLVAMFDVPTGGAGSASVPDGRVVFKVIDSVVPPYESDTPAAKSMAEQMRNAFEQDVLSQFVRRLETDTGVTVNQAAMRAATGGDQ
jgi:peptidyl-prolyl cis-trans isomerase D